MPLSSPPRTPSTISRSTSSSSFVAQHHTSSASEAEEDDDDAGNNTPSTSTSSSPRSRSRSPIPKDLRPRNDFLAPPRSTWRTISRSPSPLGLIPIHRTFSKSIHKHEVPRKLLHVSIGFLAIYLYRHGHQPSQLLRPLTAALVPVASADFLRFYSEDFNRLYIRLLGALMRESEVRGWNGVVWYLVGTITVLAVFPKDVATLSILLLSWCDTAASTFGRLWGRYTPRIRSGKSLAGSLAAAMVGAVTAAVWWGYVVPTTPAYADDPVDGIMWGGRLAIGGTEVTGGIALAAVSLLTGLVASASEVLDCWGLDDNVVIPVVSAVGIWGLLRVLG